MGEGFDERGRADCDRLIRLGEAEQNFWNLAPSLSRNLANFLAPSLKYMFRENAGNLGSEGESYKLDVDERDLVFLDKCQAQPRTNPSDQNCVGRGSDVTRP